MFGAVNSGLSAFRGGSPSYTSSAAPAMTPFFKAVARSSVFTTGPRAAFTITADGFIIAKSFAVKKFLVSSFRAICNATMSDSLSKVDLSTNFTPAI